MFRLTIRVAEAFLLGAMTLSVPTYLPSAHAGNDAHFIRDVRRVVLDNGLIVLIKPSHKASTSSVYLGVRSGSADEAEQIGSGLSHYLEHMIFTGTSRRKGHEIEREIREIGGSVNAYASYDLTLFYINFLAPHLDQALDLLSDITFHAVLPPEEFQREREVILAEFRLNEDRLSRKANVTLWELLFQTHPYGYPVIGYQSLFEEIEREDLLDYYNRHYVPNNMVLSVVGDFDPSEAESFVRKHFGSVRRGKLNKPARRAEPNQLSPRSQTIFKEAEHARLSLGFPGVSIGHRDAVALDVASFVLGEGDSSRLNQKVKEEEQNVLGISSYNATLKDDGLFGIRTRLLAEKIDEARESILREIEDLKDRPVESDALEKVKNQVLARFYGDLETHASMAHDLVTSEIYTGDYRFSEVYTNLVKGITPSDIQRVAKTYLRREVFNEVVLMPLSKKEAFTQITAERAEDMEIHRTVSANGVRLLLMEDHSVPNIILHFAVLGGTRYENERINGVSALCAELLTKGTSQMDQREVSETVEGWGGALSSFSGRDSYGITLTALSRYATDAVPLFFELLAAPAFSEEEIQKAKTLQMQALLAKEEDIFATSTDLIRKSIYKEHPYRLDPAGTVASLEKLGRQDVLDFYSLSLDPRKTVVAISGDFDKAALEKLIEAEIGRLRSNVPPDLELEPELVEETAYIAKPVQREQAMVMLVFSGVDVLDDRRYAYQLLNALMTGASGRLYRKIRGEAGLSYVVGSDLSLGVDPGYFVLYAAVDPQETESALGLLEQEVRRLRAKGVEEKELERAKIQLRGYYEQSLQSKFSKSTHAAFSELYGAGYEEFLKYPERIAAVSRDEVHQIIDKFIDLSKSVRLIVSPKVPTYKPWRISDG